MTDPFDLGREVRELQRRVQALELRRQLVAGAVGASDIAASAVDGSKIARDGWHTVGGSGEPAYVNSWSTYGGGWPGAQFMKVGGLVVISGLVQRTGGPSASTIFTLPAGFRPGDLTMFTCFGAEFTSYVSRVQVTVAGTVDWIAATSAPGTGANYQTLAGIIFVQEN